MTEERLLTVKNITSEAIEQLHRSLESCPNASEEAEDPPYLKVPLLVHQKQALAWLLWREKQKPSGGILADDMGLGKTLTMIALILAQRYNRKEETEKNPDEWISKTEVMGLGCAVEGVLTLTETKLSHSPLLKIAWSRIILDEAHNIKNPQVQTSMAVCKLQAKARWAVTGTPIQNNLLDMYSLLKFLHCSPFDEFKLWKNQVDNGTRKGGERLKIITKSLLLRRMKDQLDADGKPLVVLPQKFNRSHKLKLSDEEEAVYNVLFARS
eukprot:g48390.t1